jgi:hypothetical protein
MLSLGSATTAGRSRRWLTMPPVPELRRRNVGPFGRAEPADPILISLLGAALLVAGLVLAYLLNASLRP